MMRTEYAQWQAEIARGPRPKKHLSLWGQCLVLLPVVLVVVGLVMGVPR